MSRDRLPAILPAMRAPQSEACNMSSDSYPMQATAGGNQQDDSVGRLEPESTAKADVMSQEGGMSAFSGEISSILDSLRIYDDQVSLPHEAVIVPPNATRQLEDVKTSVNGQTLVTSKDQLEEARPGADHGHEDAVVNTERTLAGLAQLLDDMDVLVKQQQQQPQPQQQDWEAASVISITAAPVKGDKDPNVRGLQYTELRTAASARDARRQQRKCYGFCLGLFVIVAVIVIVTIVKKA